MRVFREKGDERAGGRGRGARGFFGRGGAGAETTVPDPALRDVFAAPDAEPPEDGAPFWDGPAGAAEAAAGGPSHVASRQPDPVDGPGQPGGPDLEDRGHGAADRDPTGPGDVDPGPFVARARMASRPQSRAQDWPASRPVAPSREAADGAAPAGTGAPAGRPMTRSRTRPRRIWDIEAEAEGSDGVSVPEAAPPDPGAPPIDDAARPADTPPDATAADIGAMREEVALARAQVARMAAGGGGPAGPRAGMGAGVGAGSARAKTRLLGFQAHDLAGRDPFSRGARDGTQPGPRFPVGWVVVTDGPGRGASFALTGGVASIGRGADQAIALDFGDVSISRQGHASVAYDDRENRFYLGHGGKANLVRLNGRPVVSTEDLADGDEIAIGETVLRFVALCGGAFAWTAPEEAEPQEAPHDGRQ